MENTELNQNQLHEINNIDKDLEQTLDNLSQLGQQAVHAAVNYGLDANQSVDAEKSVVLTKLNGAATPMMTGAVLGVAAGVLIQLASPKGSVQGAIAAGVVGGTAVYSARKILSDEITARHTGLGAGLFTGLVANRISLYAGRIVSDYFPSEEKIVEQPVV